MLVEIRPADRLRGKLEAALTAALAQRDRPSIINALLPPDDASPAMRRLTEHLRARVAGKK